MKFKKKKGAEEKKGRRNVINLKVFYHFDILHKYIHFIKCGKQRILSFVYFEKGKEKNGKISSPSPSSSPRNRSEKEGE